MAACDSCKAEKTDKNHVLHVRAYMVRVYGPDKCIRKDCPETAAHPSGYCTHHHDEWIHSENARHLDHVTAERTEGGRRCSRDGCDEPVAHKTSSYCNEHRKEYNQERRKRLQASS